VKQGSIIMRKKLVGLSGLPQGGTPGLLFDALARLVPVEFRSVDSSNDEPMDALIILEGILLNGLAAAAKGILSTQPLSQHIVDGVKPGIPLTVGDRLEICFERQAKAPSRI
jgi:hypothetical protein